MITHYVDLKVEDKSIGESATAEWLAAMRAMETEGERTPAQSEPHEAVMDESTPALLRKQAA